MRKKASVLTKLALAAGLAGIIAVSGCTSVPLEDSDTSDYYAAVPAPDPGKAGVYIIRDTLFAAAYKRDVGIDGKCLGRTSYNTFVYTQVDGGQDHILASYTSYYYPFFLKVHMEPGKNYFFRHYMVSLGTKASWSSALNPISEEEGRDALKSVSMVKNGNCSGLQDFTVYEPDMVYTPETIPENIRYFFY